MAAELYIFTQEVSSIHQYKSWSYFYHYILFYIKAPKNGHAKAAHTDCHVQFPVLVNFMPGPQFNAMFFRDG